MRASSKVLPIFINHCPFQFIYQRAFSMFGDILHGSFNTTPDLRSDEICLKKSGVPVQWHPPCVPSKNIQMI
jgi:hypothetical protein